MVYEIKATDTFKILYASLEGSERLWIDKIKAKLAINPTGKVLQFSWFREKKYLNKRLYYLVDETSKKILLVAFASKKDQQKTISYVINNMEQMLFTLKN